MVIAFHSDLVKHLFSHPLKTNEERKEYSLKLLIFFLNRNLVQRKCFLKFKESY